MLIVEVEVIVIVVVVVEVEVEVEVEVLAIPVIDNRCYSIKDVTQSKIAIKKR